jgi:hypothetical protein
MLTITGEAHPLKLGIYPQSVELSLIDLNCGSLDLVNEGGVPLKLRIGQGIGFQQTLSLSSSFGPTPGTWPVLSVNYNAVTLKPGETVTIKFEINPGPGEEEGEEDNEKEEEETMSTTIDILSPETSWIVDVTGIVRSNKKDEPMIVREEGEDVIDIFEESLVFDTSST